MSCTRKFVVFTVDSSQFYIINIRSQASVTRCDVNPGILGNMPAADNETAITDGRVAKARSLIGKNQWITKLSQWIIKSINQTRFIEDAK